MSKYFHGNLFLTKPESARAQYKFDTSTDVSEYTQTPASNSCSDDEYSNVNGGLCTFLPQGPLFSCGSKNHTQTGICFTNDRSDTCQGVWKSKATNQLECESKGQYCELSDGTLSLLNETSCTGCSGKSKWRYKWTGNSITSTFRLANVTDPRATAQISIVRQLCRNTVNAYQKYLYTFVNLFKAYACNCVTKADNCLKEIISLPQDDCMVNPSNFQKCGGFTFDPSKSQSTSVSNVTVFRFSSANFINNATTMPVKRMDTVPAQDSSHVTLVKRCNPLPVYEIVYSSVGGSIVGQIIGDGIMMKSSSNTYSEASICLSIDQSIPTNKAAYPYYDIGYVLDNKVYPQKASVKVDGLRVCGTVYDFPEIVYIPILRKNY